MARRPRVPKYRRHSSGQARITIRGRDHLLGPFGSPESKEAYRRLIAEWVNGPASDVVTRQAEPPLMVAELIHAYWQFAEVHYGFTENASRGDRYCLRDALRIVRALYGSVPASEYG